MQIISSIEVIFKNHRSCKLPKQIYSDLNRKQKVALSLTGGLKNGSCPLWLHIELGGHKKIVDLSLKGGHKTP